MRAYKALADLKPDFFIHSGDNIYADGVIPAEVKLPDGSVWKNIVTPAKSKPAQTLEDFRGNYAYNLLDANVRRFNSCVPVIAQWDDHEVRNNWCPGQTLTDKAYDERDTNVLSARARQAFFEYLPIRTSRDDTGRIYRSYRHGPLLDVFVIDERSYRGVNTPNRQASMSDRDAQFLAPLQLGWLKDALKRSTATWKIIASDMPLSAISADGKNYEAWANGDNGKPLGRELELADLLSFIKANKIRNTVWITADVHYQASIHYHPDRAKAFKDFDPFWEFISGPLHAGGFGPNQLDVTFGPEYRWKRPPAKGGHGPGHDFAAYGVVRVDAKSKAMRVVHHGIDGAELASQQIEPQHA
jgi:alkaline phosphatase D